MFRFAIRNLLSRPIRSLLSLMGLTVAIAGMVGLFSVAEGLDRLMSDTFDRIPGLVAIQPGAPIPLFSKLPRGWKEELEQVEGVGVVTAEIWQRVNVINGDVVLTPPRFLFGADIESRLRLRRAIYQSEMIEGRFLNLDDRGTNNTVVSRQIAEQFQTGVGRTFTVNGQDLRIVGIYHCGSLLLDVAIILDIDVVRRMTRFDADSVCAFYIEQEPGVDAAALATRIREQFRGHQVGAWNPSSVAEEFDSGGGWLRRLGQALISRSADSSDQSAAPVANGNRASVDDTDVMRVNESDTIEVRSAVEWASRFERLSGDLNIILTILTSIGIIIAVLSIVNTMLMSVSERMIEFGILKANGWSRRDVMKLIASESAVIGVLGGLFGALFGWVGTQIVNAVWPMRAQLYASPALLVFAVVFSLVLGLLGGLYPALRAMRMMPMQALRRG